MKKAVSILFLSTITLFLASCGSESTTESTDEAGTQQTCFYSYNHGSTTLEWVAFKTNDKVGVPGGFNEITVTAENGEDPVDVLESIEFEINTASVETNNEERNGKIAEHFFGTINTEQITGNVKEIGEDGKATITVSMNGIDLDVEGDYTLEDDVFTFETSIDVAGWNALSGIEALNTVCKELHTGADGVSKLWSEVTLKLVTTLSSDC